MSKKSLKNKFEPKITEIIKKSFEMLETNREVGTFMQNILVYPSEDLLHLLEHENYPYWKLIERELEEQYDRWSKNKSRKESSLCKKGK